MPYIVEPIGAHFADKDLLNLANRFNRLTADDYRLYSVFRSPNHRDV